jgi:O-succinylbenzoic acid--CoA ligase
VVDQLRPARVIGPDGEQHRRRGLPVEAGDALVMATSGTTGLAKGVILTHRAVLSSARATSARLDVDPHRHRWLACLPLNHVGGMAVVTRSLLTGTSLTVLPGFDRDAVRAAGGPDVLVALVPTALARVGADHFRTVVLGGSAPPGDLPANVISTYGLTETGSGVVYDGFPLPGVEVAIDPDSAEVRLRGPMLLRAYRDGTQPLGADGWLATGDAGEVDAAGRLHVHGRMTEMIVSGGENVWPAPVEAALLTHPSVAEVAVAGADDPDWGQRVVAWVVPADPGDPPALDELRPLVAELVAPFAAPRQLVLVERLPRTSIGKVQRARLAGPDGLPRT